MTGIGCRGVGGLGCAGLVGGAEDEAGLLFVARIQDTFQLVVARQKGVRFVNEQGGAKLLDDAKEGGRADVAFICNICRKCGTLIGACG